MNIKYVIERLPHPEHVGDWHDRPVKWVARTEEPGFTQKFSTKRGAMQWVRACKRAVNFSDAQRIYVAYE